MRLDYIKHKIANLLSINKIVTIHYYELHKNFRYDGESHNFWEMVYIDAGNVKIKANNKELNLKQGEVIFHKILHNNRRVIGVHYRYYHFHNQILLLY